MPIPEGVRLSRANIIEFVGITSRRNELTVGEAGIVSHRLYHQGYFDKPDNKVNTYYYRTDKGYADPTESENYEKAFEKLNGENVILSDNLSNEKRKVFALKQETEKQSSIIAVLKREVKDLKSKIVNTPTASWSVKTLRTSMIMIIDIADRTLSETEVKK